MDEATLGVVMDGTKGVAVRARSREAGSLMRATSALLGEGVRVAARVRRDARLRFERMGQLKRGMAALRAEVMAATPRELEGLRAGRRGQAEVVARAERLGPREAVSRGRSAWGRVVEHKREWREQGMEGEVWLAGHMRLWRAARVARRWLYLHRRRALARHEGTLDLVAAGITVEEMGDGFVREAEEALRAGSSTTRARLLWREAAFRVRVLCTMGLFRRAVAEKRRAGKRKRGGRKGRGKGKTRKQKVAPPAEVRGKRRLAEVADFERYLERTERTYVAALDDGGWVRAEPVPSWAARERLQPGEWREGETAQRRRNAQAARRGSLTRGERLYSLAAHTGSLRTLWMVGGDASGV